MKIHLISSMREFHEDFEIVNSIANTVKEHKSTIILNWFNGVYDRQVRGVDKEASFDWMEIVDTNINATKECDALIIEGSRFNYSQGFQTALALEYGKPVLNLYREDLPEYKEWPDKLFVSGISNPLFTSKAYKNEEDLEKIVTEFLQDRAAKTHELNLKLALDATAYGKINQLAHDQNKSTTSVIKDILLESLDTNTRLLK